MDRQTRLRELEAYMEEANSQVGIIYRDYEKHNFQNYEKDGLKELKNSLKNLTLGVVNLIGEYRNLTDKESPLDFGIFASLQSKLVNRIDAEIACRLYFNDEVKENK